MRAISGDFSGPNERSTGGRPCERSWCVVFKLLDDAQSLVEFEERGNSTHALADILSPAGVCISASK